MKAFTQCIGLNVTYASLAFAQNFTSSTTDVRR